MKAILLGLLLAAPAHAGKFYENTFDGTKNQVRTGYTGSTHATAVVVSSGQAVVVSTFTGVGEDALRVEDSAGTVLLKVSSTGTVTVGDRLQGNITGTAAALAANGANCSAGNYPLGVDASGAVESCTAAGIGDAVLNSTQVWSGGNELYGSTTFYGYVKSGSGGNVIASTMVFRCDELSGTGTAVPLDGSIPQITEGTRVLQSTFTPTFLNTKVRFTVNVVGGCSTAGHLYAVPVFLNNAADAIFTTSHYSDTSNNASGTPGGKEIPSWSGPQVVDVHIGCQASSQASLNRAQANSTFGGTCSWLKVEEVTIADQ